MVSRACEYQMDAGVGGRTAIGISSQAGKWTIEQAGLIDLYSGSLKERDNKSVVSAVISYRACGLALAWVLCLRSGGQLVAFRHGCNIRKKPLTCELACKVIV